MPTLFLSDEVPNYFVEYDFSPENRASDRFDDDILRDFEAGKCITFKNWTVDFDRDFFGGLDLENNRPAKKLKSVLADERTLDPGKLGAFLSLCAKDAKTIEAFPQHAQHVASQVVPIVNRIFKNQQFFERRLTWRMLDTVHEDLHVDVYPGEKSDFQIRMFINLDVVPRIWHTSHSLDSLLTLFGDRLTDDELATHGPTALIRIINQRVYGGLSNAGRDGQPRHTAFFQPGEVWMVDSRRISHQIFYGRRALSVDYFADPTRMRDPSSYYLNAVEAYRAERGITRTAGHLQAA